MADMGKINELIHHGLLDEAIAECIGGVKSNPTDVSHRVYLYELSAFCGDWKRCVNQVETIVQLGGDALHWAGHMANLNSEKHRDAFWKSSTALPPPIVGGDDYAYEIAESVALSKQSNSALAAHAENFGGLDFGPCIINGVEYASLAFVDSRLSGFLEASEQGEYVWIYAGGVKSIELAEPMGDLTRLLWIPAKITLADGSIRVCALSGLYPDTYNSANNEVKLGKDNEWSEGIEDLNIGRGPVLFAADDTIIPLIDTITLTFPENQESAITIE
jgi:protein involved in temperature-dependent protein secretion